jgi:hypothetical protein
VVTWPPRAVTTGDIDGDTVSDMVSADFYNGLIGVSLTWAGLPRLSSTWGTILGCSACATCWLPT